MVMHKFALCLGRHGTWFSLTADADKSGDVGRDDATLLYAAPRVGGRRVRMGYWRQALVDAARNTRPVLGHHSVTCGWDVTRKKITWGVLLSLVRRVIPVAIVGSEGVI